MNQEQKTPVFQLGMVSRGTGTWKAAVDVMAYVLGKIWESKYDGKTYDHSDKAEEVVYATTLAPDGLPDWVYQPYTLAHAIEYAEKAKNAQLMRSLYFTLPRELGRSQQIELLTEYVQEAFVSRGMIALCAIHNTAGNPNAHILLTLRPLLPDGWFLPKSKDIPVLDEQGQRIRLPSGRYKTQKVTLTDWSDQANCEQWRKLWAEKINKYYRLAGIDIQIDHRSHKRRELTKLPTLYMNPIDAEAEQHEERTEIGNLNRWIVEENQRRESYEKKKEAIDTLVETFAKKYKSLSRREQWRSPQKRAAQQFWSDLHAIEAQFDGKKAATGASSLHPSKGHHAPTGRRQRDPSSEME